MLSAYPASGKTTWAREYQKNHDEVYIINSDAIRLELTGGNYIRENNRLYYREAEWPRKENQNAS